MYITIEGPIGVGKSSLTRLIAAELTYKPIFEIVEENPFLERFYEEQDKYAFQTEMFFLTNRYTQLKELKEEYLDFNIPVVSDYNIHKNMLFASNTLTNSDFSLFTEVYDSMYKNLSKSDLTIFLSASLETLKYRIAKRGREFETNISDDYLLSLIRDYNTYVIQEQEKNPEKVLVIDGDNFDFVNDLDAKESVMDLINFKIKQHKEGIHEQSKF